MLGMNTTRGRTLALALAGVLLMCGCGGGGGGSSSGSPGSDTNQGGLVVGSFRPPSESTADFDDDVTFEVEATADVTPSYRWTVDGIVRPERGKNLSLRTGNAATVHIVMVDVTAGNQTTTLHWRLNVVRGQENQPPVITAAFPQGPVEVPRGTQVDFLVLASDPDAKDRISFQWFVNGGQHPETSQAFHLSTSHLVPATHQVEARVSDGNSHPSLPSHVWELIVTPAPSQNQPPVIISVSPEQGPSVPEDTILTLMVEASDPEDDPLTYRWSVDGATRGGNSSSFQFDASSVQPGPHSVHVLVSDGQDNGTASDPSYSWIINVKASSLVVEVVWDPVTRDVLGQPETVTSYRVYVTQNISQVGQPTTTSSSPSVELSNLVAGRTYFLAVTAVDAAGNESDLSQWVTITL